MYNTISGTNNIYTAASTATVTTGNNLVWVNTTVGGSTIPMPMFLNQDVRIIEKVPDIIDLKVGQKKAINFPDGTTITFEKDGSFVIDDANSKVIYKAARCHDFNPFINASDKLEDFIRYCGDVGVRQGDMLGIPIKHFVQWLVIEAAKADGEATSEMLTLPNYSQPRCRSCQRFMSPKLKANAIEFCRPRCLEVKLKELSNDSPRLSVR